MRRAIESPRQFPCDVQFRPHPPSRGRLGAVPAVLLLLTLITLAAAAETPTPPDGDEIIALVGADSIRAEELLVQARRNPKLADEDATAYRHRLLQPLVNRLLLRSEAQHRGLFDDPAVLEQLAEIEDRELQRRIDEQLGGRDAVEEQVIEEFGLEFDSDTVSQLASAFTPFDMKNPDDLRGPLLEPGAVDSTLVIYRTHDEIYTVADFQASPSARRTIASAQWVGDPEKLSSDLARGYANRSAPRLARRRGLDQVPDYVTWATRQREELAVTRLYQTAVLDEAQPSDGELRAFYEANRKRFRSDDVVETDSFSFTDSTDARRIARALDQGLPVSTVYAMVRSSAAFGQRRNLKQPVNSFERDTGQLPTAGDVVCSVRVGTSWVHRVLSVEVGQVSPFETVERQVRREVEEQRAEEGLMDLLDEIRSRVPVVVYDQALARVPI